MSTANANNARTPLDSTSSRNATDTRKRSSNKLAKKSQKDKSKNGSTKGAAGSAIINALFWVLSIGFVLGALALVPGPLQDRLLVAIGRLERKDTSGLYPVKTKILADREKRASIFRAFQHAWFGYERHAFGADEYHPVSQSGSNLTQSQSSGPSTSIGYTIIDTLDMFLLLSLNEDGASLGKSYRRTRKWLKEEHTFDVDANFNTFELTIRLLGGLLSAHWAEYEVGITPGLGTQEEEEDERFRASQTGASDANPASEEQGRKPFERSTRRNDEDDHYDPSDMLYLHKAVDLADRLMGAFTTRSGLPWSNINLKTRVGSSSDQEHGLVSTAEIGTLQLEFRYLSYMLVQQLHQIPHDQLHTMSLPSYLKDEDGNPKTVEELRTYWNAVENAMKVAREGTRTRLPSVFMNPADGEFIVSPVRLGSRGDSYFEYLLKQYLQTSRKERDLLRMWDDAIDQIHENLLLRTPKRDLLFVAELDPEQDQQGQISWRREPKQDHLTCFLAGTLMLSAAHTRGTNDPNVQSASIPPKPSDFEAGSRAARDWRTGEDLLKSCYDTQKTSTGLSPEIVHFRTSTEPDWVRQKARGEWYIKGAPPNEPPPLDARYILRPEIVESIFVAYRLTADPKYRRWGWKIFEAIEQHCKVPTGGYAGVVNVEDVPVQWEDKMETFFLSETLKYLYLLFSDDSVLPLEDIVFNTEAHPLPKFTPEWETAFM